MGAASRSINVDTQHSNSEASSNPDKVQSPLPGARESNAGDDFHVLWAVRQALQLLDPHSNLCLLVMEGLTPPDMVANDEEDFLGVDLTEYYKGDDFSNASKVITSQLKYSTRHPNRAWTAARLCTGRRNDASVIKRLADIYKGMSNATPRHEVLTKLSIRLVSNQPLDTDLALALDVAQTGLHVAGSQSIPIQTGKLLKQLPEDSAEILKRLHGASGLTSSQFTDFLRVLDFSNCGAESRIFQGLRVIQSLGLMLNENPREGVRRLYELVRDQAMPEHSKSPGLTSADVLAALGVADPDQLFPAPSRLDLPEKPIETSDISELASAVMSNEAKYVLAHGDAGVGKTTTIQQLEQHLPEGSVVVIYDCFGRGDYLQPGQQRHLESRAFVQIINELAVRCGLPIMVQPPRIAADLQRRFSGFVERVAKVIAATDGALLVLVIDAADNAVIAAREQRDDSFVPLIWRFPLPDNCRIVVTSRSHRRDSLQARNNTEFQFTGFDELASTTHLQRFFPEATSEHGHRFHMHTEGNPRWQTYRLRAEPNAEKGQNELEDFLSHSRGTLKQMFADLWDAAVERATDRGSAELYLATLMCLSRPVSVPLVAETCGVPDREVESFVSALRPGMILEDETISFRDEDFETFLRDHLREDQVLEAHDRLGTFFLGRSDRDAYAARYVVEHLMQANRLADVISLAVGKSAPAAIESEMLRSEVVRRRIALAIQAVAELGDARNGLRLILLAADTARTNGAVTALVRESPELAARFGDIDAVARLYLREENNSWLGSAHLRIAAMYARDPSQRKAAEAQMQLAEAWIRLYSARRSQGRYDWNLTARDIAAGAETIFWLHGPKRAVSWLKRWRPLKPVLEAAEHLVVNLAEALPQNEHASVLRESNLPWWVMPSVLAALWRAHSSTERVVVHQTAEWLDNFTRRRKLPRELPTDWATDFCELAAAQGVDTDRVLHLIDALCPKFPETPPWRGEDFSYYDLPLRVACLKAEITGRNLKIEDLLTDDFRKSQNYDRHEFDETVGRMLGVYKARARSISLRSIDVASLRNEIERDLQAYLKVTEYRWFRPNIRYALWAKRACDIVLLGSGSAEEMLQAVANAAEPVYGIPAPSLWLDMADLLLPDERYRALGWRLVARVEKIITSKPLPGSERWQLLLRCAEIANRYDATIAQEYYKSSLSAAEGIDDDNAPLLALQSHIACGIAPQIPVSQRQNIARRLGGLAEAYQPYTSSSTVIPWETVLRAVTRLDVPSGFVLCSRWDDDDRLQLHEGIIPVVHEAIDASFITPREALALLRLAGEELDISSDAVAFLERLRANGAVARPELAQLVEIVSNWIRRDIPVHKRKDANQLVIDWARAHRLEQLSGIVALQAMLTWTEQLGAGKRQEEHTYQTHSEEVPVIETLMNYARAGSLEDFDARIRTAWMRSYGPEPLRDYLSALGHALSPSARETFLDLLTHTEVRSYFAQGIVAGLSACLLEWRSWDPVRRWAASGLSIFLDNHLLAILEGDSTGETLQALLDVPQTQSNRTALVLNSLVKHLDGLTPSSLYGAARALSKSLTASDLQEVLDWSITQEEKKLMREGRELPSMPAPPYSDPASVLAIFLWVLFGHPDKRVRWRALHTGRMFNLHANMLLLSKIVSALEKQSAGPFRPAHLDSYWLSACSWLLVLLDRIADDHPGALVGHVEAISRYALDPEMPHAQIRELARRIVLRILEHAPEALPEDTKAQVRYANRPVGCRLKTTTDAAGSGRKQRETDLGPVERKAGRFSFPFDVPEYWFAALARVFDVGNDEVAERAEKWIVDKWGYTDGDWWKDPRELGGRYERRLATRHQSGAPEVETLHIYLAYHAMLCAAGEMIASLPIDVTLYDDGPNEPWEYWLGEHMTAKQECWLADLRAPTPYREDCWGEFPPVEDWLTKIDASEYDEALGLAEPQHASEIVAYGHYEVRDENRTGSIRVTSALVNPSTSHSLMRALQVAHVYDYALPIGNETYSEVTSDEPGFELKPWLYSSGHMQQGLDEFDPLGQLKTTSLIGVSTDFLNQMEATYIPKRQVYIDRTGTLIGRREIWNDQPEDYGYTHRYSAQSFSTGERLWVRADTLLRYLRYCSRDLIIQVQITRNRPSTQREREEEYDPGRATIYLLRRDGTLETLGRSRQIGTAYNP
jgi:hypothetical protein